MRARAFLYAIVCFAALLSAASAEAFQLITPEEAALPSATMATLALRGSPTRRPGIVVISPPVDAGLMHSPLDLKLEFRAFGGSKIDPNTVVLTYLKEPLIDITQRIAQFITADGISITKVQVPPGKHQFWIELKDNNGRLGGTEFGFQIAK